MDCQLCGLDQTEGFRVVYQNAFALVVVNIEPVKDGHLMVLPVRHTEQLADLNADEAREFLQTIDRCIAALSGKCNETPICFLNSGKHRTQAHLHAHVLPSKGGLRSLFAAAEGTAERRRLDNETLATIAAELRPLFITKTP